MANYTDDQRKQHAKFMKLLAKTCLPPPVSYPAPNGQVTVVTKKYK